MRLLNVVLWFAVYCFAVFFWADGILAWNLVILGLNILAAGHSTVLYGKLLEGLAGAQSFVASSEKMHALLLQLKKNVDDQLMNGRELASHTEKLADEIDAKLRLHRFYANETEERVRDLITKAKGN